MMIFVFGRLVPLYMVTSPGCPSTIFLLLFRQKGGVTFTVLKTNVTKLEASLCRILGILICKDMDEAYVSTWRSVRSWNNMEYAVLKV